MDTNNMKKLSQKIIQTTIVSIMMFSVFTVVYAQNEYTVLAPLPGTTNCDEGPACDQTSLQKYLPAVFNLSIGIAAAMAFVAITWGGILYATSDAIMGKEQGKEWITNAVWGLLLVIGAYAILYTINPRILEFNLSLEKPNVIKAGVPTVTPGIPMSQAAIDESNTMKTALSDYGIDTKNPCSQGQTTNCVNLNGLPVNMVNDLIALKSTCNCSVFISGGTEGGHDTHGSGAGIVDLRPDVNLNKYITGNANTPIDGFSTTKTLPGGSKVKFTYEVLGGNAAGTSSGDHWHTQAI